MMVGSNTKHMLGTTSCSLYTPAPPPYLTSSVLFPAPSTRNRSRLGDMAAASAGPGAPPDGAAAAGPKKKSRKSKKKKKRRGASKGLFRKKPEEGRSSGGGDADSARGGPGTGDGEDEENGERGPGGMEAFLKGLEDAAAGVREALATIAHPLHVSKRAYNLRAFGRRGKDDHSLSSPRVWRTENGGDLGRWWRFGLFGDQVFQE